MNTFEYANPTTLREAVSLLGPGWNDAAVLAGGTDLLSLMKNNVVAPKRLVNIKNVKELGGISESAAGIRIGAAVTLQEMHDHKLIHDNFHLLAHAAGSIASMQMKNMGTVGGDLCQRPRCWYFRNGFGLLARDEKGRALVPGGDNRYHAILGNAGPAYFVNPSSLAPPLVALGARVRLTGPGGSREVELASFYRIPRSDAERENVLRPNEILTEVLIPAAARGLQGATYAVWQKDSFDWPLAVASVALRKQGKRVSNARVVLGHVAPVPWRAPEAERLLAGKEITPELAAQAGEAAIRGAKALSMNGYKIQLARVAVKRALLELAGEHGEEGSHGQSE